MSVIRVLKSDPFCRRRWRDAAEGLEGFKGERVRLSERART